MWYWDKQKKIDFWFNICWTWGLQRRSERHTTSVEISSHNGLNDNIFFLNWHVFFQMFKLLTVDKIKKKETSNFGVSIMKHVTIFLLFSLQLRVLIQCFMSTKRLFPSDKELSRERFFPFHEEMKEDDFFRHKEHWTDVEVLIDWYIWKWQSNLVIETTFFFFF